MALSANIPTIIPKTKLLMLEKRTSKQCYMDKSDLDSNDNYLLCTPLLCDNHSQIHKMIMFRQFLNYHIVNKRTNHSP